MIDGVNHVLAVARGRAEADPARAASIIAGAVNEATMQAMAHNDFGSLTAEAQRVVDVLARRFDTMAYTVPVLDAAIAEINGS